MKETEKIPNTPFEEAQLHDKDHQCDHCRYDLKYKVWRCYDNYWHGKLPCSVIQQAICTYAKK
jgi:hypothetical protein